MSNNCSFFSSSIDPSNLKKITSKNDVSDLLSCLENDSTEYLKSLTNLDDRFKNQYDAIINVLITVILKEPFVKTTDKFFKLSDIKSGSFQIPIVELLSDYLKNIAHRKFLCEKEIGKSLPLTREEWVNLNKSDKKIVVTLEKEQQKLLNTFITQLTGCIGNAFFSFEHSCRVVTGYICLRNALKMAKELTIQHKEVWKTLKKLGGLRWSEILVKKAQEITHRGSS